MVKVTSIEIRESVCKMCGSCITIVGQECLKIRAMEFPGLCKRYVVDSNAALTEQGMWEIIYACSEVFIV